MDVSILLGLLEFTRRSQLFGGATGDGRRALRGVGGPGSGGGVAD